MNYKKFLLMLNGVFILWLFYYLLKHYNDFNFKTDSLFFLVILIAVNVIIVLEIIVIEKIIQLFEKRKSKKYSLNEWLYETNISMELSKELSSIKKFNSKNLNENYELTKKIIIKHYKSEKELKHLQMRLSISKDSIRWSAFINSTQTIIITFLFPVITITMNYLNKPFQLGLIAVIYIIFWIGLVMFIEAISEGMARIKILHELVSECLNESDYRNS